MGRRRIGVGLLATATLGGLLAAGAPGAGPGAALTPRALQPLTATVAPKLVQTAGATESAAAASLTATFPAATQAGRLLVVAASVFTGTTGRISSVTDSAGNTWKRIGAFAISGRNTDGELWFTDNARAVTKVTVHTPAAEVVAFTAQEFSGVVASAPVDISRGAAGTGTAAASGAVRPVASGDLVVGFLAGHGHDQAMQVTAAGYTVQPQRTSTSRSGLASVVVATKVASLTTVQQLTGSFASTMNWSAGIAMFVPATNDFSLHASPASRSVVAGNKTTSSLGTAVTSGVGQSVALSVSGLPAGASARIDPPTITSGHAATLTMFTSVSTPAGTSTVTVTGTGVSATRTTTLSLTVQAPTAIRAAFFYPWFPQAWSQQGQNPFTNYTPTRGFYGIDLSTVRAQIADMQRAHITLGLASWWGQGTTTDQHWPALMQAAQHTGFTWAPYYEPEGIGDPTPQQIANDLHYLWTTYQSADASNPAHLPGKGMVVFVYNADDPTQTKGCDTVDRWNQARQLLHDQFGEIVYIDLKVFPGYAACAGTPSIDGWHQYGPASANQNFATAPGDGSFSISPGYWKSGATYGTAPFLARDRARWRSSITSMQSSGAFWQLVTTYNEWGEGTAIESSSGCRNPAPAGTYCDWSGNGTVSDFVADLQAATPG